MLNKKRLIRLKGGIEVIVNLSNFSFCKVCGKKIWWAQTLYSNLIPIQKCGIIDFGSHFLSCSAAKRVRIKPLRQQTLYDY